MNEWWTSNTPLQGTMLALDTETNILPDGQVNDVVIGTISDGVNEYLLQPRDFFPLWDYIVAHDITLVMHNAAFDLAVIQKYMTDVDVYARVDRNKVIDTMILYELYTIASKGFVPSSSLAAAAKDILGQYVEKHGTYNGKEIRKSFGDYINNPLELPEEYKEYALGDATVTYNLAKALIERTLLLYSTLNSTNTFGMLDREDLLDNIRTHGLLTHNIQIKAQIALDACRTRGLRCSRQAVLDHMERFRYAQQILQDELAKSGWQRGVTGNSSIIQHKLHLISEKRVANGQDPLETTPTGKYTTEAGVLEKQKVYEDDPFFELYSKEQHLNHLITYLQNVYTDWGMFGSDFETDQVHSFLRACAAVTGRTSSSHPNIQNTPRETGIREVFIPHDGYVFLDIDYSFIELVTLAEAVERQFKQKSVMQETINAGEDIHKKTASAMLGKPIEEVTKEDRQKAKAINFGKPGGMGAKNLMEYAAANYGVYMTIEEAGISSRAWEDTYPEMRYFLYQAERPETEALADHLGLNFTYAGDLPRSEQLAITGGMIMKILANRYPTSKSGKPYNAAHIAKTWYSLKEWIKDRPYKQAESKFITAIQNEEPSMELSKWVLMKVSSNYVMTLTGRVRQTGFFTEKHNYIFQALAADGAKIAMWELFRKGYRMVNFIHDEFLLEVPVADDYTQVLADVKKIVEDGMRKVILHTRVSSEGEITNVWSKSGKLVVEEGKVKCWHYTPQGTQS